jgi:WD40 repeat protein
VLPEVKAGVAYGLAFSKCQTLAVAYGDGSVRLWGTGGAPTKERHKLEGHADCASSVAFSPDEKLLFSGGADWMVRSWDLKADKERFQPDSHLSSANGVAFAPDGRTLATADTSGRTLKEDGPYGALGMCWSIASNTSSGVNRAITSPERYSHRTAPRRSTRIVVGASASAPSGPACGWIRPAASDRP